MLRAHHRFYLAAFFMDFAVSCAFTAIPFLIYDHLGGGARMSGSIGAVQSLFYGLTCLLTAGIVAHTQRGMYWAVAGSLGFGVVLPLAVFCTKPVTFTVCTVTGCSLMALFWPAMQSWIGGDPNPARRAQRIGTFNIAWSAGLAVAPVMAGPMYEMNPKWPFAGVFLTSIVAMLLVMTLPHDASHTHAASADDAAANAHHDRASEAHLWCGWCANFLGWAMVGVMRSVFPKRIDELVKAGELVVGTGSYAWEHLHWGAATQYSWLMLGMYTIRAVASYGLGMWPVWRHRFSALVLSQAAAAGAFWMLGVTKSLAVMVACALVVGISGAVTFFASLYYSVANPALKHRRAAVHEATVGLGSFTGALVFGELAGRFGTTWPFLCAPVFVAAGIALQYALLRVRAGQAQ